MFLAYDKVLFAQYDLYQKYAELTPATDEAKDVARQILYTSKSDETVQGLNEALREAVIRDGFIAVEYYLFTVRNVSGETFDIYLLDEDSLFKAGAADVAEADVVKTAEDIMLNLPSLAFLRSRA